MLPFLWLSLITCVSGTQLTYRDVITRQNTNQTTGDAQCGSLMCVSATLNGSVVEYILSSTGKQKLGWMAMGFGQQMANSPMVILWPNSDGSITLSQRSARSEVMPTVDNNPPRVASVSTSLSSVSLPSLSRVRSILMVDRQMWMCVWGPGTPRYGV